MKENSQDSKGAALFDVTDQLAPKDGVEVLSCQVVNDLVDLAVIEVTLSKVVASSVPGVRNRAA
jgi:hypothetical protein